MKESVIFEKKIAEVLKYNSDQSLDECIYILLSIDDECVYWLLKLQSDILSQEFLNLLKFIIPSGVQIIGVLYLGKIEDKHFKSITEDFYTKLRKFSQENQLDILRKVFYSIVINKVEVSFSSNSCIGLIYSNKESEIDKIILVDNFNKVNYLNLDKVVKSEYFIVNSIINPLTIKCSDNVEVNALYSSNIGLNFRDLNITIPNLIPFYNMTSDSSEKLLNESVMLNSKHRSRLERFINYKDRDDIKTICYFLMDASMNEYNSLEERNNIMYSSQDDKKNELTLSSIKISVTCLFPRNQNLTILDISFKMLDRYYFLMKEFHMMNKNQSNSFSIYSLYNPSCIPIPLGIVYFGDDKYEETEENLITQRAFFHKIFNLPANKPHIKRVQIENKLEDYFKNQLSLEIINSKKCFINLYKNIHINKIKSIEGAYIKGDYYYYHTGLEHSINKAESISVNYRSLQTYISWFNLNGYTNIEIPSIDEINKILIYLGQISSSNLISNLNLENIACILSYIVDIKIDVISIKNKKEFGILSKELYENILNNKIPILLSTHSINTLVGISKDFTNYLLVSHENTGSNNLYHKILKSNACQWKSIEELFSDDYDLEILVAKPNQAI